MHEIFQGSGMGPHPVLQRLWECLCMAPTKRGLSGLCCQPFAPGHSITSTSSSLHYFYLRDALAASGGRNQGKRLLGVES